MRAAFIEPEVNSLAAVPACCREFEDPVDPRLLLESLLSKLFPFLKDLFMVSASSTFATTAMKERPSNLRFSLPPSESRHFHPRAIVVSMITASKERQAQVLLGAPLSATMPSNRHPFPSQQILLLPSRTLPPQSRSAVSPMHSLRSLSPARRPATATLLLPFHYHSKTEPPLLPPPPRRTLSASPPLDRRRQQQGPSLPLSLSLHS